MRMKFGAAAVLAAVMASGANAQEQEFVAGDGTSFSLAMENGVPARAETDEATFESAGFDMVTSGTLLLTDRFAFLFRGGDQPVRVRVEDITLATPVVLVDAPVPENLPGAGFRRSRFELQAPSCPIARGEPCSAWMFGTQSYRLYRATLTYTDRGPVTLLQAEPFQMASFVQRLGDRIPDATVRQP
jgi:hypothetical protein